MEKIFDTDPHIVSFQAVVTECIQDFRTGHFEVILDQTAFFPEEGGQSADKGTLQGQTVLDVKIRQNVIYHILEQPLSPGTAVTGLVDWAQRFDFMQQHSGEHILSGLVNSRYGYDNVGFHLGLSDVTLDFNGVLTLEQLRELELAANNVIWNNLPVRTSFPERETLKAMIYRSKIELSGAVRIVEIPGVDVCACCAPHVDATGQIGILKVTGLQSYKGGVRIHILCGKRALQDYTLRQECISTISTSLSAKPEAVADAVLRLKQDVLRQKEHGNRLQAELLKQEIEKLPSPECQPHAIVFTGPLDSIAMRNAVNTLCPRYTGFCGIFSGSAGNYQYIIGSRFKDCNALSEQLKINFKAKGGGSSAMIQGTVAAAKEQLSQLFL